MIPEYYNAIAEIMKRFEHDWEAICIELADYFEKEDEKDFQHLQEKFGTTNVVRFNKKQFLKDCGIEV